MRILFEDHPYPTELLASLGLAHIASPAGQLGSAVRAVGYSRRDPTSPPVFVMPKTVLHAGTFLRRYDPAALASTEAHLVLSHSDFARSSALAEIIFFCLRRFQRETQTNLVATSPSPAIRSNIGPLSSSSIEAMLSLIAFNRRNPTLLLQARESAKSARTERIDWKRTISATTPTPVRQGWFYSSPIGRATVPQRKDPLLQLYIGLLREFRSFDPTISIDPSFTVPSRSEYSRLRRQAPLVLRTIATRYFTDALRELHALLRVYFHAEQAAFSRGQTEHLLSPAFQTIFERLVDALLSDEHLLLEYRELKDGKQIDHLFGETDAFGGQRIIYIGDSKYYRDPRDIRAQRHKQFSYARSIIQENIYVINRGEHTEYSRNYRDSLTEGYNVTPNFFLIATVDPSLKRLDPPLRPSPILPERTFHFPNRLFGRDTLHVLYFQIDLLALLDHYVLHQRRHPSRARADRARSRATIRAATTRYVTDNYSLNTVLLPPQAIHRNFRLLIGKLFVSPATYPRAILALERDAPDNEAVLGLLGSLGLPLDPLSAEDLLQA